MSSLEKRNKKYCYSCFYDSSPYPYVNGVIWLASGLSGARTYKLENYVNENYMQSLVVTFKLITFVETRI